MRVPSYLNKNSNGKEITHRELDLAKKRSVAAMDELRAEYGDKLPFIETWVASPVSPYTSLNINGKRIDSFRLWYTFQLPHSKEARWNLTGKDEDDAEILLSPVFSAKLACSKTGGTLYDDGDARYDPDAVVSPFAYMYRIVTNGILYYNKYEEYVQLTPASFFHNFRSDVGAFAPYIMDSNSSLKEVIANFKFTVGCYLRFIYNGAGRDSFRLLETRKFNYDTLEYIQRP
jgi:hypothetical protein